MQHNATQRNGPCGFSFWVGKISHASQAVIIAGACIHTKITRNNNMTAMSMVMMVGYRGLLVGY